jgi:hypothetical protein
MPGCLSRGLVNLGRKPEALTFLSSLVLFLALAIILSFLTKTQPTGTSLTAKASSAYCASENHLRDSSISHHYYGLLHPAVVDGVCRGIHGVHRTLTSLVM